MTQAQFNFRVALSISVHTMSTARVSGSTEGRSCDFEDYGEHLAIRSRQYVKDGMTGQPRRSCGI
jgi:hypothetical protein